MQLLRVIILNRYSIFFNDIHIFMLYNAVSRWNMVWWDGLGTIKSSLQATKCHFWHWSPRSQSECHVDFENVTEALQVKYSLYISYHTLILKCSQRSKFAENFIRIGWILGPVRILLMLKMTQFLHVTGCTAFFTKFHVSEFKS